MHTLSGTLPTSTNPQVNKLQIILACPVIPFFLSKTSFSYICENYPNVVNLKDNLNRTSLHYACIMNDEATIDLLQQANAKKVFEFASFHV